MDSVRKIVRRIIYIYIFREIWLINLYRVYIYIYIRGSRVSWMFVKQSEAFGEFSNAFGNLRDDVTKLVSSLEQATRNIFRDACNFERL